MYAVNSIPSSCVVLKGTSALPDRTVRLETIGWIRSEFERNRYISDVVSPPFFTTYTRILSP